MLNKIKFLLCLVGALTLFFFLLASCNPPPEPLPSCEGSLTLPGTQAGSGWESLAEFAWSPDGKYIAFREKKGTILLLVVDKIFGNQVLPEPHELSRQIGFDIAWSPDSKQLAFTLREEDGDDIHKIDIDSGQEIRITNSEWSGNPTWFPDGEHIALYRNGIFHIMESDGSNPIQLLEDPIREFAVSPSGEKVAYSSNEGDIYVIDIASSHREQLTNTDVCEGYPIWSPNGQKIAFESAHNGAFGDIFVMNTDGSHQINLTNSERGEGQVSWAPDGRQIAFVAERDIYVMNADGSKLTQITITSNEDESLPLWSPDGQYLAFMVYSDQQWHLDAVNQELVRLRLVSVNK